MTSVITCCDLTCDSTAEFEIVDDLDMTETQTTYACEPHVGAVLGHALHVEEVGRVESWSVRWMKGQP